MSGILNPLLIRNRLGRDDWCAPVEFGEEGWSFDCRGPKVGRIIVTASDFTALGQRPGEMWIHASWSWQVRLPSYDEMKWLHTAVWPDGYAYQVFAPPSQHVNLHAYALHLWGRADGRPVLPEFGKFGTI
jgi:hypothetical protein